MDENRTELNQELTEAFDNPEDFDFGFQEQRADTGFANFDFDPNEAARMRDAEGFEYDDEYDDEEDFLYRYG